MDARDRPGDVAFIAPAREGDFEALLEVLDPDAVRRADRSAVAIGASSVVRGAANVARQAVAFSRLDIEGAAVRDLGLHDPKPKDRRDGRPR